MIFIILMLKCPNPIDVKYNIAWSILKCPIFLIDAITLATVIIDFYGKLNKFLLLFVKGIVK
jgi:hypothetical protein